MLGRVGMILQRQNIAQNVNAQPQRNVIVNKMKITHFCIGKNKCYKGIAITIYRLKLEIISFKNKRVYRIEWNDWNE